MTRWLDLVSPTPSKRLRAEKALLADYFEVPHWHPEKEAMFKLLLKSGFIGCGPKSASYRIFDLPGKEVRVWVNKYTGVWESKGTSGTGLGSLAGFLKEVVCTR